MPQVKTTSVTRIHLSPYRPEIEKLLRQGVPKTVITRKYAPLMNMKEVNFYKILQRYEKNRGKHANVSLANLTTGPIIDPGNGVIAQPSKTVEEFAAKLLQIGMQMAEENPGQVRMRDVISAQKLLMDKQKLKLDEQSMMLNIAKLFGGFGAPSFDGELDATPQSRAAQEPNSLLREGIGNTASSRPGEVGNERP